MEMIDELRMVREEKTKSGRDYPGSIIVTCGEFVLFRKRLYSNPLQVTDYPHVVSSLR